MNGGNTLSARINPEFYRPIPREEWIGCERRLHRRYPLRLPLTYVTSGRIGAGETKNISSGGLLFYADARLRLQSKVTLLIDWPSRDREGRRQALAIIGVVVRQHNVIAVRILSHRFVSTFLAQRTESDGYADSIGPTPSVD